MSDGHEGENRSKKSKSAKSPPASHAEGDQDIAALSGLLDDVVDALGRTSRRFSRERSLLTSIANDEAATGAESALRLYVAAELEAACTDLRKIAQQLKTTMATTRRRPRG
ncbi:MAG: hypothetical protein FJX36_10925 [Alphaproteobacteria bacterium]|nr:hypothetical protein [Alphaproteobacteria bacterium]